jgi:TonB family protein
MQVRIKIPSVTGAERDRSRALAISLAVHATAFVALMHAPEIRLPQASPSEYRQAIAGKEEKLVWYKFNKALPNVNQPRAQAGKQPVRAEVRAKQQIVASPKNAPKRTQMVWTEAPALPEIVPLESPNVLAMRMQDIAPPAKPPARAFVPPDIVKPELAKVEVLPDAPQIAAQTLSPVALPEPAKIVKRFIPPPKKVPVKLTEVAPAPETPILAVAVKPNSPVLEYSLRLPPRPFTAPPAPRAVTKQVSIEMPETPPQLNADALTARELNLAVVGLKPAEIPAPLPAASSPAQFSAGPAVRPEGANAARDGKGISVPDLFVSGAPREAKPDLIAQAFAAPTSSVAIREALRSASTAPGTTVRAPATRALQASQSGAIQVSGAPDPRFNGRETYMMAIQMPNLTSFSGSWLMWYADRTQKEAGLAPVAPPVAWRKVDPKYVATAVADRIEGKVRLACVIDREGHVSTIEVVNGLDDRLNQSAAEALAKWEFTPASRQGKPVEVDVLVEIPFKLEPHTPVSF